jgi:hypothetical protein
MADTKFSCRNCGENPPFHGWDECLECGVAGMLIEQPEYLAFARRVFADEPKWLVQLEAEWVRQASALPSFARAVA